MHRMLICKVCRIVIFLTLFTVRDNVHCQTPVKEIPLTRVGFSQYTSGPKLKFQYCYSCGYHKAFVEYGNIIQQKYPEIIIEGENYNPPNYLMFIAKIMGATKILFIVGIISGINFLNFLGYPPPSWWIWCLQNKMYSCMIIFFTCNAVESQLMSTGAFEIAFNDVPVWSKLETGRIPQPAELFQIIDNNLQFQGNVEGKSTFSK